MRVGRIVSVKPFERARNPSYKVEVDVGPLGRKWSSAQITNYSEAELVGRLVVCVVNMPPRNIAGFQSEVLILGAKNARSEVILLSPLAEIALGEQVF
jgi:tRNA-binding protein